MYVGFFVKVNDSKHQIEILLKPYIPFHFRYIYEKSDFIVCLLIFINRSVGKFMRDHWLHF